MIKLELTEQEIDIINEALGLWETDPQSGGMTTELIGMMLCPPDHREEFKTDRAQRMRQGAEESQKSKRQSVVLRAKIVQAENRMSEFPTEKAEEAKP